MEFFLFFFLFVFVFYLPTSVERKRIPLKYLCPNVYVCEGRFEPGREWTPVSGASLPFSCLIFIFCLTFAS